MTKFHGPYIYSSGRCAGRRYVIVLDENGKRDRQILYSRWIMETKMGRRLDPSEHVHHVDEDFTNDDIDNLEIVPIADHTRHHRPEPEWVDFICPVCDQSARKLARHVRSNRKMNKKGPFCGRRCAGIFSTMAK